MTQYFKNIAAALAAVALTTTTISVAASLPLVQTPQLVAAPLLA